MFHQATGFNPISPPIIENQIGKGPKGFKRPDARISEDICIILANDPYVDATEISVKVQKGKVILMGSIDHPINKLRAEQIIGCVFGITEIENNIEPVEPQNEPAAEAKS